MPANKTKTQHKTFYNTQLHNSFWKFQNIFWICFNETSFRVHCHSLLHANLHCRLMIFQGCKDGKNISRVKIDNFQGSIFALIHLKWKVLSEMFIFTYEFYEDQRQLLEWTKFREVFQPLRRSWGWYCLVNYYPP